MRDQLKHVHLQHHSLREQQTHAVIRQEGTDVDGVNESKSAVTNADSKSKAKSWKETQAQKKKKDRGRFNKYNVVKDWLYLD